MEARCQLQDCLLQLQDIYTLAITLSHQQYSLTRSQGLRVIILSLDGGRGKVSILPQLDSQGYVKNVIACQGYSPFPTNETCLFYHRTTRLRGMRFCALQELFSTGNIISYFHSHAHTKVLRVIHSYHQLFVLIDR
ncbi:unnamed protein product [Arabis nemorensis]|uniref:Uncharacterized protein n=1 Tax=Arabis nemorensis TaxID=586526 RepID=A0A565BH56_9BRAS|nr:unnamed protein product [Arabis nemorensis]